MVLADTPMTVFILAVSSAAATPPYYILDPSTFREALGEDYNWAVNNVPLFESSDVTLDLVYIYRWRVLRSHIHPTGRVDGIDWVITEFAPNVRWAGMYNTINCAAGHHLTEAGWLREPNVTWSYARWWVSPDARHNYYYWWASAMRSYYEKQGSAVLPLLRDTVPLYKDQQFRLYADGSLPTANAAFSSEHDCLWNVPGNEGQENTLSGPGCRTLVQSLMFGEASALGMLCEAINDHAGAREMASEAHQWQRRVLRLWNTNTSSFDTRRMGRPSRPPVPPPPEPVPAGFTRLPSHDDTFCCDQSPCVHGHANFLYQGSIDAAACFRRCEGDEPVSVENHSVGVMFLYVMESTKQ